MAHYSHSEVLLGCRLCLGWAYVRTGVEAVRPWTVEASSVEDSVASEHLQTPGQHSASYQVGVQVSCPCQP